MQTDLINDLQHEIQVLTASVNRLMQTGTAKAQADHDYRVALAQEILIQKDKGMQATLMSDVCRGKKEIAKLRLERDIAETVYQVNIEVINAKKLIIRVMESQISREWGRNDQT
jgi:hypothetical protein